MSVEYYNKYTYIYFNEEAHNTKKLFLLKLLYLVKTIKNYLVKIQCKKKIIILEDVIKTYFRIAT